MAEDCLFCTIIQGDIPADKLYEDDELLVFRDINPVAPLHFLVIPKKHISGPSEVTAEDERIIGKMMRIGNQVAKEENIEQFRLVFNNGPEAGQTVFHIHMHVLGGRSLNWPPG
ncbi:MAG: histidine triad nucleotide-binding protein [Candidatus Electrothrix sp. MAN1_4]|nr:histidine triad nucleotide-binding protein [Candidatus Electrothrix sp. MAN1_4]